jgi:CHAT domain-containing protein/tetratricopeptide (TPR) repeat protein
MMRRKMRYAWSRGGGWGTTPATFGRIAKAAFATVLVLGGPVLLSPQAHAQTEAAQPAPVDETARLEQVKAETLKLMQAGRYAEAVPLAEEALKLTESLKGRVDVHTAVAAHNLGFLQRRAGKVEEARLNLERALAIYQTAHPAVHEDTRNAAGELGQIYLRSGRGEDVAKLYAQLLARAATEGYGTHIGAAHLHNNYAFVLRMLGRPDMSEAEWLKATAIYSTRITPDDDAYRLAIEGLLDRYGATGRTVEARALIAETLTRLESVGQSGGRIALRLLNRLSGIDHAAGRYAEARQNAEAALALAEKAGPEAASDLVNALNNFARAERALANYPAAEALYKRAIALLDGKGDAANSGIITDNLGAMLGQIGRLDEAERYNKRALQLLEQALGRDHKEVGVAAGNFGVLLKEARRYHEAEPLLRRGLAIAEKQTAQDRVGIGIITDNLAGLLRETGRPREALAFSERAMALFSASLPADHPTYALALNNFATILLDLGRFPEAKDQLLKSHALNEAQLGADHVSTAITASNLAQAYAGVGDKAKARELFAQSLGSLEARFGASHSRLLRTLLPFGRLELDDGKPATALPIFERAAAIEAATLRHASIGASSSKPGETSRAAYFGLLDALWRTGGDKDPAVMARAAEIGQQTSISEAAMALAALGARAGAAEAGLGALTRQRQDLAAEWQSGDARLSRLLSRTGDRDTGAEQTLRDRLGEIETKLVAIDGELGSKFPRYEDLAQPQPLPVDELRSLLNPDEAAIQFAVGPDATHVWMVSKTRLRWLRIAITEADLLDQVRALRCGLDIAEWTEAGRARCQRLLDLPADYSPRGSAALPFHTGRAHALFKLLFAPLGDAIKGKDLIVVASGPLTSLPLQVLVTDDPEPKDRKARGPVTLDKTAWLVRNHALTVLPSLASLRSLRQLAQASKAASPFIGIGNPLLTGETGDDRRAWSRQACDAPAPLVAEAPKTIELASATPVAQLLRGAPIDPESLRRQPPLPETADELCTVAKHVGAPPQSVLLGANATEARVKALSETGALAASRIVHFATHGLLAGETEAFLASHAEPALMLTPPEAASDTDDGLLTASEVASLKLDADWVILSACNTASGDHVGAEALSGLTRAFFYAGARSLLVSHWAVDSDATVKLITGTYQAISRNPRTGHAEGLRQAMLDLVGGGGWQSHPAYWAPFIVVGGNGVGGDALASAETTAATATTVNTVATVAVTVTATPPVIPPLPLRLPAGIRPSPPAEQGQQLRRAIPPDDWEARVFRQ